ncbi:MAG TPA: OmpH family outer membrane protein [Bryobacteraceae bacterium]|jgi:outer membrane protein|nr:OmpH family outer membrane protein [Bryobacteraceae bacterium]
MFRSLALAVCAAGLFSVPSAMAQVKVGVVSLQKAILDTAEIKKAGTDMQVKYKKRQDDLDKAQRELTDIQTQLQSAQGKLSAAGEADLTARGQRKEREVKRLDEDLRADVERDRTDILSRAQTRMLDIVKKLSDEKGLDLVVEATAVISFKPALDITPDAVKSYDKAYPPK